MIGPLLERELSPRRQFLRPFQRLHVLCNGIARVALIPRTGLPSWEIRQWVSESPTIFIFVFSQVHVRPIRCGSPDIVVCFMRIVLVINIISILFMLSFFSRLLGSSLTASGRNCFPTTTRTSALLYLGGCYSQRQKLNLVSRF